MSSEKTERLRGEPAYFPGGSAGVAGHSGERRAGPPRVLLLILGVLALVCGLLVLSISWFVAGDWRELRGPVPAEGGLGRYRALPEFELVERSGRSVALEDLRGKVWICALFFASCGGPCPRLSERLAQLDIALAREPDVRIVSVSVDPLHDTPGVLREYAARYGASARWLFLTGSGDSIGHLARDGLMLAADGEGDSGELIHSTKIVLVDRGGVVRGYYDSEAPSLMGRLLADIGRLIGEEGR